jgi:hypothetical protein
VADAQRLLARAGFGHVAGKRGRQGLLHDLSARHRVVDDQYAHIHLVVLSVCGRPTPFSERQGLPSNR